MSKTEIQVGSDYLEFIYKFHDTMQQQQLQLVYEGEVNQTITKAFTSMTEKTMDESNENTTTKRRVYHVMVECLQNISKHADDKETGEPITPGSGIFLVGTLEDHYTVTTGNVISNERLMEMTELLEKVNKLDQAELKDLYRKTIRENRLSEKGGAGLGIIDIAKKTGEKLDYHFVKLNELTSFFMLKTKISKNY